MPENLANSSGLSKTITMDIMMQKWPETIPVLLKNKMHCVGCLLACFHDITDAALEHGLDEEDIFAQLIAATNE